jgi:hypothetical protein
MVFEQRICEGYADLILAFFLILPFWAILDQSWVILDISLIFFFEGETRLLNASDMTRQIGK